MSYDQYAKQQGQRDKNYREAWASPEAKAWLASLPEHERRKFEADGLLEPMLPKDCSSNNCNTDEDEDLPHEVSVDAPTIPSEDSLDAILADYPHLEQAIENRARKMAGGSDAGEILRKLALLFIDEQRPALYADCLAFVSGLAIRMGESGTSLAKRHGITRQAFHKRCNEIRIKLGLPPSRSQKSDQSKLSYRLSNRRWNSD